MLPTAALGPLSGGVFLGWTVGANDAANCFGTAVASRIISFRRACILCGLAVILGAILQGQAGLHTLSGLVQQDIHTILICTVAAAVTGTIMTALRIPISTSQAIVGAILGIGLATGNVHWDKLIRVVICWIATPLGAMIVSCLAYRLLGWFFAHVPMSMLTRDKLLWGGLLIVGVYGSYALGANNVAIATGVFSGQFQSITDQHLVLIGGAAIALGVLTYSKRVMMAVGAGIMPLDAFTALVAVSAMALTVHAFAVVGVPVSTSQGIVGAIVGIGLIRRTNAIHFRTLRNIACGWVMTPILALILAAAAHAIFIH